MPRHATDEQRRESGCIRRTTGAVVLARALRRLLPSRLRGAGSLALLGTLAAQLVAGLLIANRPVVAPIDHRSLAASIVVEPPLGGAPRALSEVDSVPADSRLQLTFEPSGSTWTAVLWFDGDTVTALYPSALRDEEGWTEQRVYAVPGPGRWLRLTPTGGGADFVAVVSSLRPDPEITAALANPTTDSVRRLRETLSHAAGMRQRVEDGVERYLPTPDGRSVAAPWSRVLGGGPLVLGWSITVESSPWTDPVTSSSSAQASPARSSPSAS